jgi:hypothetical protein
MRKLLLLSSLCLVFFTGCTPVAFAQASPFNLNVYKAQSFIATGQTGSTIQLNGLVIPSTVGSSYASGTITLTGTAITTVSFQVMGSSDNGATYYALPVFTVANPGTSPVTTVTVTAAGLYQVSLAGLTHIKFVTTGTFTATSVSFTLTGSPNASISRNGSGGGPLPSGIPFTSTPGGTPVTATAANIVAPWTSCTGTDSILNSSGSCLPAVGTMSSFLNSVRVVGSSATTDLGAEINAAFSACSSNCEVDVRAGTYPDLTTVVINKNTQLLKGLGSKGSVIASYTGSGDAILYQTNPFAALTNANSGGIENFFVMGTSAGVSGIHTGNVIGGHLYNVEVEGFTGAAGKCIWIDNVKDSGGHSGWYERNTWMNVSVGANTGLLSQSCTYDIYADNNNATNSVGYDRILDLQMNVNPGQYGIYLDGSTGQVFWYNGTLNATCNVNSGSAQTGSIPECVHITNNSNMVFNQVKLDGENNCLSGQSCDQTTGYGIHVLSGGQFLNAGEQTYQAWHLGVINDNYLTLNSLAFTSNFPYNSLVSTDEDVVIATGPQIAGSYWIYANGTSGSNREHAMQVVVAANRFDAHYNLVVPLQYAFNNQVVISNPRVVYDANSAPQLVVTIGNRNGTAVQMYAQYAGTSDHIPAILNGATVGTTAATQVFTYIVGYDGNVTTNQNYTTTGNTQAARASVTDCFQLAATAGAPCVMKSVTVPISADGTYILADSASNLTGRYVISWSSPSRNHFIIADVAATRFDSIYSMTKTVDYAFGSQPVLTGLAVLSDSSSDPQLQITIGNRNDGSNPDNLTVTWYGDASNSPNLLAGGTLGTTARTNIPPPVASAMNLAGATVGSLPFQSAAGTTGYLSGTGLVKLNGASGAVFAVPGIDYQVTQPHMYFGGYSGTTFTSASTNYGGAPVLTVALKTVAMTMHLDTTPVGCATPAQISLYDEGTLASPSTTLVSGSTITLVNGKADYNVAFTATLTATHLYNWGTTVQQVGCSTNGGGPHFNVEFVMP